MATEIKSIILTRSDWGDDKGQLKGKITFVDGKSNELAMNVSHDKATQIVALLTEVIVESAQALANDMIASTIISNSNLIEQKMENDDEPF